MWLKYSLYEEATIKDRYFRLNCAKNLFRARSSSAPTAQVSAHWHAAKTSSISCYDTMHAEVLFNNGVFNGSLRRFL